MFACDRARLLGAWMKKKKIFNFPPENHGSGSPTIPSRSFHVVSATCVAEESDPASRRRLRAEVRSFFLFLLGNNFVSDRLIYILAIKLKTHKKTVTVNKGVCVCVWLRVGLCTYPLQTKIPPCLTCPKAIIKLFCARCIVSVISHRFL